MVLLSLEQYTNSPSGEVCNVGKDGDDPIAQFFTRKRVSEKAYREIVLRGNTPESERFFELGGGGTSGNQNAALTARNCTKAAILVPTAYIGFTHGLGFPDKDISLLGIGNHRYFLFHSAIGVYVLKKFYDWYLTEITGREDLTARVTRKVFGTLVGASAVGVGIHLMIDVFQPKSVVFPFFGSLVNGTLVDDRLWLLGNSLWCFKIARDVFVIAIGKELGEVRDYVNRTYAGPLDGARRGVF